MTTADSDSEVYNAHWAMFPILFAKRYTLRTYANFKASRARTKAIIIGLLVFYAVLIITFVVIGPKRVSHAVYAAAQGLRATPGGEFILGAIMVATSVPPLIGFTTTTGLCGYVYGLRGFAIAAPATYLGSAFSFVLLRLLFRHRIRAWANDSPNWKALGSVIRAKGLPLICLIRLCPLPWTGSNMLFASIETVTFGQFMLATTPLQIKIFMAVFVGSRLANLSDGEKKDSTTTIINTISILVTITIAALTGVYVWRITRAEIEKLESISSEERHQAENALEDLEEAPFVEPYRD